MHDHPEGKQLRVKGGIAQLSCRTSYMLWYRVGCSNASAQCYEIITENGGLTWICSACRAALLFAVTKTRTINAENAAMRAQLSEMYIKIKSLQETFSQRDAIESATVNAGCKAPCPGTVYITLAKITWKKPKPLGL